MIIYIDKEYKCHITDDSTMTAIETEFFNDKCNAFIEGYCYEINDNGESIYPWKSYSELDLAQREYEKKLLEQYKTELAELDAVLLDVQYKNLVEGL